MRIRTLHGPLGPLCSIQDRLGSHPSAAPARGLKERKLGSWAGSPPLPQTLVAPAGRSLGGVGPRPGSGPAQPQPYRPLLAPGLRDWAPLPLIPKPWDSKDFSPGPFVSEWP